jgi:hypothetical protein
MSRALSVAWMVAYSLLPVAVVPFALIFAFEGFASARRFGYNLPLAIVAVLVLIAWPASALGGWWLLALGRRRAAVWLTALAAVVLLLLWLVALAVIVAFQRR